MVASLSVEIPFHRVFRRQRGWTTGELSQFFGRTASPTLPKYIVPVAKRVGADLLEFASPETAEVVSDRKNFKTSVKSVERQTPRKLLDSGNRKRTARRLRPRKTTKQTCRSRRDIFTNFLIKHVEHFSETNFLWQFLEILVGSSQFLTLSCRPSNKKLSYYLT